MNVLVGDAVCHGDRISHDASVEALDGPLRKSFMKSVRHGEFVDDVTMYDLLIHLIPFGT